MLRSLNSMLRSFASEKPAKSLSSLQDILKSEIDARPQRECWKLQEQPIKWTINDVERFSTGLANGLLQIGLTPGDKIAGWLICDNYAELLTLQLASALAGFHYVTIESSDSLQELTKDASALVFSPWKLVGQEYRVDKVIGLVPELLKTQYGQQLKSAQFKSLKHVIQVGHTSIRGTLKFKQVPVYSDAQLAGSLQQPVLTYNGNTFTTETILKHGDQLVDKVKLNRGAGIVNGLSHRYPLQTVTAFASLKHGVRATFAGKTDSGAACQSQRSSVLIIDAERAKLVRTKTEIETLVAAVQNSSEVEATEKALRDRGLLFSKTIAINPASLEFL